MEKIGKMFADELMKNYDYYRDLSIDDKYLHHEIESLYWHVDDINSMINRYHSYHSNEDTRIANIVKTFLDLIGKMKLNMTNKINARFFDNESKNLATELIDELYS